MERPDRIALWAVGMCLLLVFVAATSARAASDAPGERAAGEAGARAAASLGERTLKVGKSGRDVRSLQVKLRRMDFFSGKADGRFGRRTKAAVVRYQRSRCLKADGIVGSGTARAILRRKGSCKGSGRGSPGKGRSKVSRAYSANDLGARTLERGNRGRDVRTLQRLLGMPPDGSFGASTLRAMRRFQRRAGLEYDGRVGPLTRQALASRAMSGRMATWYGPGFYGKRTACGQTMSTKLRGVAHRTLPCGTPVVLSFRGRFITVPVVDRGPYTAPFVLDLTAGAAQVLGFSGSGAIRARYP
jgi:peptidoglycan hydrolase-like protein with peptidoglycan-binding domain